ncbi:MAG: PTS sugar transporter subunit IIC [Clostridia bacterium]|nr:PTS sugar transporter subunit IIC [Clostridia bacterium]
MEIIKKFFKRYFVDAMSYMALGLFSTLIIGLIIGQIAKIPGLGILSQLTTVLGASSPVVGAAIGGAIAYGLKMKPLTVFSTIAVGAIGYALGGPVGAFVSGVVGAEVGNILAGKTKIDIILTPFITIVSGGLIGIFVGPYLNQFMTAFGNFINSTTELHPIPMGILVSVLIGLALTAPISSAAICITIGLNGIAAGAAVVGCCCQMVGFAVASFRDNGWGGLLSQGIGTSMLQFGNIMKKPTIWLAPTLASAVLGPISTQVLGMTNNPSGAGMGTSGLVGQFGAFAAMEGTVETWVIWVEVIVMHFVLPALFTLAFDAIFRKIGWVKKGDMKLETLSK